MSYQLLNKRLKEMHEEMDSLKKNGVHEDILIAWLCFNLKISKKKAGEFLKSYEDFYNKLISKEVVDRL